MANADIATILYEIADILELQGTPWKPRAYKQAARVINSLPNDVADIYRKGGITLLKEISGVGEHIAKKIEEFLLTGKISAYEKLKKSIPNHLDLLLKIPGIGPKKLKKLNEKLNIKTITDLKRAAENNKISSIKGFNVKSQKQILEGIALLKSSQSKIPYKKAFNIAKKTVKPLESLNYLKKISIAGSLRRKKIFVNDIDILVSSNNPIRVINFFSNMKNIKKILVKGSKKISVILDSGIQVDLRVVPLKSWGAALLYFTGSKNYNIYLRKVAIKKNLKLSEYGLFDKKNNFLAGKTEISIIKKLNLKFLKPEERNL